MCPRCRVKFERVAEDEQHKRELEVAGSHSSVPDDCQTHSRATGRLSLVIRNPHNTKRAKTTMKMVGPS